MFTATMNKGFQMKFDNNLVLSVQWGPSNYCEARAYDKGFWYPLEHGKEETWKSKDAEIAIWYGDGQKWLTAQIYKHCHELGLEELNDEVVGHLSTNEVLKVANVVASLKKEVIDWLLTLKGPLDPSDDDDNEEI